MAHVDTVELKSQLQIRELYYGKVDSLQDPEYNIQLNFSSIYR